MTGVSRDVILSLYCVCDNILRVHLIPAEDHILIVFLFSVIGNTCLRENGVKTSSRAQGWLGCVCVYVYI
jgi:hypothetical protein